MTLYGQRFQKDGSVTGDESMSKQGFESGISFDRKGIFLSYKILLCITFEKHIKIFYGRIPLKIFYFSFRIYNIYNNIEKSCLNQKQQAVKKTYFC